MQHAPASDERRQRSVKLPPTTAGRAPPPPAKSPPPPPPKTPTILSRLHARTPSPLGSPRQNAALQAALPPLPGAGKRSAATTPTPSTGGRWLWCEPERVQFAQCNAGERHTAKIRLSNFGSQAQKFSVDTTQLGAFSVRTGDGGELPKVLSVIPGFSLVVQVSVDISAGAPFSHKLAAALSLARVDCNSDVLTVPIVAEPATPRISGLVPAVDLGLLVLREPLLAPELAPDEFVPPAVRTSSTMHLKNAGPRASIVRLSVPDGVDGLQVSPAQLELEPGAGGIVTVTLERRTCGKVDGAILAEAFCRDDADPGDAVLRTAVAVRAQVVRSRVRLSTAGSASVESLRQLDFGTVYFEQPTQIRVTLANVTDDPVRWVLSYATENSPNLLVSDSAEKQSAAVSRESTNTAAMCASPMDGFLGPKGTTQVAFEFHPRAADAELGASGLARALAYQVAMRLDVTLVDADGESTQAPQDAFDMLVRGRACALNVTVEPRTLDFGELTRGATESRTLHLENQSRELAAVVRLPKPPHFRIEPLLVELPPGGAAAVPVMFLPNQIGSELGGLLPLELLPAVDEPALGVLPVELRASCAPTYPVSVVVQPGDAANVPAHAFSHVRGAAMNREAAADARRTGVSPKTTVRVTPDQLRDALVESSPERDASRARRTPYDAFIRSATPLVQPDNGKSEGEDAKDAEAVLAEHRPGIVEYSGSRPGSGVRPASGAPRIPNWRRNEWQRQLLVPAATRRAERAVARRPALFTGSDGAPEDLEESPPVPRLLSASELALVFTGQAVIDLGRVTMHSEQAFPLNFCNAMDAADGQTVSVSVRVISAARANSAEDADAAQIRIKPQRIDVPSGAVEGFEATFRSDRLGPVQRKLVYIVNGHYRFAVRFQAQVVALALELDPPLVQLDFAALSVHGGTLSVPAGGSRELRLQCPRAQPGAVTSDAPGTTPQQQFLMGELVLQVRNTGSFEAGFMWTVAPKSARQRSQAALAAQQQKRAAAVRATDFMSARASQASSVATSDHASLRHLTQLQAPQSSWFLVSPAFGHVGPQETVQVSVRLVLGVQNTCDELLQLDIVDLHNGANTIVSTLSVPFRSVYPKIETSITHTSKHAYLDFGVLPVAFDAQLSRLGALSAAVFGQLGSGAGLAGSATLDGLSGTPPARPRRALALPSTPKPPSEPAATLPGTTKAVRVRNLCNSFSFYAVTVENDAGVAVEPRFGILPPLAQNVDISVTPQPTHEGSVENALTIQIYGNETPTRIPFRYHARKPDVRFALAPAESARQTCIVGMTVKVPFKLRNQSPYGTRALLSLGPAQAQLVCFTRVVDEDGFDSSTFPAGSDSSWTQAVTVEVPSSSLIPNSTAVTQGAHGEKEPAKVAVFELPPQHTVYGVIVFAPTMPGSVDQALPLYVYGMPVPFAVPVCASAQLPPLQLGATSLRFRNRLVVSSSDRAAGASWTSGSSMLGGGAGFGSMYGSATEGSGSVSVLGGGGLAAARRMRAGSGSGIDAASSNSATTLAGVAGPPAAPRAPNAPSVLSVEVSNVSAEPATFVVGKLQFDDSPSSSDDAAQPQPVFHVVPQSETLAPGEVCQLQVLFRPMRRGRFAATVPLFLSAAGTTAAPSDPAAAALLHLHVQGNGVGPAMVFDPPEALVPLNCMDAQLSFPVTLVSYGLERTDVKCLVPPEIAQTVGDLSVIFPEGRFLRSSGDRLRVVLKFVPKTTADLRGRGVGFSTKIEFRDNHNRSYFLPVHAAVDNTALPLSLRWYPLGGSAGLGGAAETAERKVVLRDAERGPALEELPQFSDAELRAAYSNDSTVAAAQTCSLLGAPLGDDTAVASHISRLDHAMRWLHERLVTPATGRSFDEANWPYGYAAAHGVPMLQAMASLCDFAAGGARLEAATNGVPLATAARGHERSLGGYSPAATRGVSPLAGKNATGTAATNGASSQTPAYHQAVQLLNHFKSAGLVLALVKPEFLLTAEEFARLCAARDRSEALWDEDTAHIARMQRHHGVFAREAWFLLLNQILAVGVGAHLPARRYQQFQQPTPAHETTTAAAPQPPSDVDSDDSLLDWPASVCLQSNVTSPGEGFLLRFYSWLYQLETRRRWRPLSVVGAFDDGNLFAMAIRHYVPAVYRRHLAQMTLSEEGTLQLSPGQLAENGRMLRAALADLFRLGNGDQLLPSDALERRDLVVLLLLAHVLHQALPQFAQTTALAVTCKMYGSTARLIELSNPYTTDLEYCAVLEPNLAFHLPRSSVVVPARSSAVVRLEATVKLATPTSAQLYFVPRRLPLHGLHIFVYGLTANADAVAPLRSATLQCPVYSSDPARASIDVTNPLAAAGNFTVSLVFQRVVSDVAQKPDAQPADADRYCPLHIETPALQLEAGATARLAVNFLPLRLGVEVYHVHFVDPLVGEFVYAVSCVGTLPAEDAVLAWEAPVLTTLTRAVAVPPRHAQRDAAVRAFLGMVAHQDLPEWRPDAAGLMHYVPVMGAELPAGADGSAGEAGDSPVVRKLRALHLEQTRSRQHHLLALRRRLEWPSGPDGAALQYRVFVLPADAAALEHRAQPAQQRRLLEQLFARAGAASHTVHLQASGSVFKAPAELLVPPDGPDAALSVSFYALRPGRSACFVVLQGVNVSDVRVYLVQVLATLSDAGAISGASSSRH